LVFKPGYLYGVFGRAYSTLMRAAAVWTIALSAALAGVLTTAAPRSDKDGEGPWLGVTIACVWLAGLALLILLARMRKTHR
jgi:hypothetical protein